MRSFSKNAMYERRDAALVSKIDRGKDTLLVSARFRTRREQATSIIGLFADHVAAKSITASGGS